MSSHARTGTGTTIQSVSRASQILIAIAGAPEGLTAKQVAERFRLSLPTSYHLLATLTEEGLLAKDQKRMYALGPIAAVIADAINRDTRPPEYFESALRELARATGETAYLSAWRNGKIRVLSTVEGVYAVRVAGLVKGYAEDAHARASGKVLLAHASPDTVQSVIGKRLLRKVTPRTITSRKVLLAELEKIRIDGFARDLEEFSPGVSCMSVPVWIKGIVVACFTVSAPSQRFEVNESEILRELRNAAQKASRGSVSPDTPPQ